MFIEVRNVEKITLRKRKKTEKKERKKHNFLAKRKTPSPNLNSPSRHWFNIVPCSPPPLIPLSSGLALVLSLSVIFLFILFIFSRLIVLDHIITFITFLLSLPCTTLTLSLLNLNREEGDHCTSYNTPFIIILSALVGSLLPGISTPVTKYVPSISMTCCLLSCLECQSAWCAMPSLPIISHPPSSQGGRRSANVPGAALIVVGFAQDSIQKRDFATII